MGTFLVLVGFVHRCVNLVLVVLGPVVVVVEVLAVAAVRVGPLHLQVYLSVFLIETGLSQQWFC